MKRWEVVGSCHTLQISDLLHILMTAGKLTKSLPSYSPELLEVDLIFRILEEIFFPDTLTDERCLEMCTSACDLVNLILVHQLNLICDGVSFS